MAKKKFGLRALAVCYDFPFLTNLARQNIKNVCSNIDLDLLIIKSKDNLENDLIRNHLISLAPTGTTWGQCMFCHYGIDAVLYNVAKEKKIPFILSGVTINEVWWNPGNRIKFLLAHIKKLPIHKILNFLFYQSKAYLKLVNQRKQFRIPGNSCLNVYKRAVLPTDCPEILNVFDYIKWDNNGIEKTLKEKTGWIKPDKAISWRYDCILEPLLDYTYLKEFGVSNVGLYLSSLIREGVITRDEAVKIQKESENEDILKQSVKKVYEILKIPESILNTFFNA